MTRGPAETSGLAKWKMKWKTGWKHFFLQLRVGSVSVTVTLENGPQYIYAVNENINESKIEEKNDSGGHRITTKTTNSDQMVRTICRYGRRSAAGGSKRNKAQNCRHSRCC